jgi:hypothetical protein
MIVTKSWIEKNYNKFNDMLWEGKLPAIKFKTTHAKNNWGSARFLYDYKNDTIIPEQIIISNYYDSPEYVKIQTLLHEMIHIADYTFNPNHFIRNRKPVKVSEYDPHGNWFMDEAWRISKESGYDVWRCVTKREQLVSKVSKKTKEHTNRRMEDALICAVTGDNDIVFYFKTDVHKVKYLEKEMKNIVWARFDSVKKVQYYTFSSPKIAQRRSCAKDLRGWFSTVYSFPMVLKKMKAVEVTNNVR